MKGLTLNVGLFNQMTYRKTLPAYTSLWPVAKPSVRKPSITFKAPSQTPSNSVASYTATAGLPAVHRRPPLQTPVAETSAR